MDCWGRVRRSSVWPPRLVPGYSSLFSAVVKRDCCVSQRMAYTRPATLDGFVPLLARPDLRVRQLLGEDLLGYLTNPANDLCCEDLGLLVDGLLPWINGGNFKVRTHFITPRKICRHHLHIQRRN